MPLPRAWRAGLSGRAARPRRESRRARYRRSLTTHLDRDLPALLDGASTRAAPTGAPGRPQHGRAARLRTARARGAARLAHRDRDAAPARREAPAPAARVGAARSLRGLAPRSISFRSIVFLRVLSTPLSRPGARGALRLLQRLDGTREPRRAPSRRRCARSLRVPTRSRQVFEETSPLCGLRRGAARRNGPVAALHRLAAAGRGCGRHRRSSSRRARPSRRSMRRPGGTAIRDRDPARHPRRRDRGPPRPRYGRSDLEVPAEPNRPRERAPDRRRRRSRLRSRHSPARGCRCRCARGSRSRGSGRPSSRSRAPRADRRRDRAGARSASGATCAGHRARCRTLRFARRAHSFSGSRAALRDRREQARAAKPVARAVVGRERRVTTGRTPSTPPSAHGRGAPRRSRPAPPAADGSRRTPCRRRASPRLVTVIVAPASLWPAQRSRRARATRSRSAAISSRRPSRRRRAARARAGRRPCAARSRRRGGCRAGRRTPRRASSRSAPGTRCSAHHHCLEQQRRREQPIVTARPRFSLGEPGDGART